MTGATGFLGHYLVAELARRGADVVTAGRTRCDLSLDLEEPGGFVDTLRGVEPFDLAIHAGAMSRMGACQSRPTVALKVNGKAPVALARAVRCRFVQISTDMVFDGDGAPYHAASKPRPLSVYGMSKAAGEQLDVQDWLVLRIPLLFGRSFDGAGGATDMLRGGVGAKEKVALFTNEYRTPMHAADAAEGVVDLAYDRSVRGIRHLAGPERVSRWDLARRFCAAVGIREDEFRAEISEDPRRPKDASLIGDWIPRRGLDVALGDC